MENEFVIEQLVRFLMPLGGLVPEPPEPPLPAPPDPDPSGGVHDPFCQRSNQLLKQNISNQC